MHYSQIKSQKSQFPPKIKLFKQTGEREYKKCCQFWPVYNMHLNPCNSTPYSDTC